jgi:tRNA(Ile2) C34 agmatinyltransferase TiaS
VIHDSFPEYVFAMTNLIIVAIIACVVVFIIAKVLKKDEVQKSICPSCGKAYGGKPAKCPHCGEQLRWKNQ